MDLLAGGVIGRGRAGLERWWRMNEWGDLLIGGNEGTTCRLVLGGDGVWRGRWLEFERMDVELVPLSGEEPERALSRESREPIDVVYTWVDGADPQFQANLRRYRPRASRIFDTESTATRRFRDNDDLRYSLRSLERFAPFIRDVYLVTNGQVPHWIKQDHPRLHLVRHEEIFPSRSLLPTFNSFAIELHLHRIPTLSQRFLYFNDDFLVGAPLSFDDLISRDGVQTVMTDEPPGRAWLPGRSTFDRSINYTLSLLDRELGHPLRWTSLPHAPRLFDRERIVEVQKRFERAISETSAQRFRAAKSVAWHVLYMNYVATAPRLRTHTNVMRLTPNDNYMFVMMSRDLKAMREKLEDVKVQRPQFFCFNDDLDGSESAQHQLDELRAFLADYYPEPSGFEA